MSVLIVHPDDSPVAGPWAENRWDFVLDLGWAGQTAYREWEKKMGCPVRGLYGYAEGPPDFQSIGAALSSCRGVMMDDSGLDWWEILAPLRALEMLQLLVTRRALRELGETDFVGTRLHPMAVMVGKAAGREIRFYMKDAESSGIGGRFQRMRTAVALLTPAQLLQAALDKWDPGYRVRGRVTFRGRAGTSGAVLLPSGYANVTRMLNAYAKLLPKQPFLLVTTRKGGEMTGLAQNVRMAPLAGFAVGSMASSTRKEVRSLRESWGRLQEGLLRADVELAAANDNGWFREIGTSIENWLRVRDAWKNVLNTEHIAAVLCGDENNATNRIPALLAGKRNLRTVHCDHGALNALLPLRSPACDLYLVKGEMEGDFMTRTFGISPQRVLPGAPPTPFATGAGLREHSPKPGKIVFFSEQLELTMGRTRILYEELLPRLCSLAREYGTRVVVKLHPFESPALRREYIDSAVSAQDREIVELIHGPLTEELLESSWFALTVESGVSVDCAIRGIPCFFCSWFGTPIAGYEKQFVRYGAARALHSPDEVARIPEMLKEFEISPEVQRGLWSPMSPARLEELLGKPC